ncbi:hypothetical protein BVY01_04435 [bacterium I07]|nr:hypothetical protein BVY01_04435 [bacterium I07]
MPTIDYTKKLDKTDKRAAWIEDRLKDPREYRNILLMEYLRSSGIQMRDVDLFQDILGMCERNGVSFLDWYLKAEDAIKTLRKNRELEEMEALFERVP